jgi:hypothetical protein
MVPLLIALHCVGKADSNLEKSVMRLQNAFAVDSL